MYSLVKRLQDIVLSLLLMLLSFPVIVIFAVLIRLKSNGKIFYSHERLGLKGTPFRMWKLRTMFSNSKELLLLHLKENPVAKAEWDNYYCLKNDPRIVGSAGKFARKFSVDELPQFFNVLKGEMSIVGPRPVPIEEHNLFPEKERELRNSVKPGVTGLWQISGRSELTIYEKLELDIEYINDKSIYTDIKIILQTPYSILKSEGAY